MSNQSNERTVKVHCADEPIHIPGSIQPHGVLLALSGAGVIQQVSDNTLAVLAKCPHDLLGRELSEVLSDSASMTVKRLVDQCQLEGNAQSATIDRLVDEKKQAFDVIVHKSGVFVVVELEPVCREAQDLSLQVLQAQVGYFTVRLQQASTTDEQSQIVAEEIRKLTGFGRVKVYQFDEQWNGCVVAESKSESMVSYLGQHFPAGDIPEQARLLYTKNPVRLIADAAYQPAELLLAEPQFGPLDMTFSVLRSVSPVHLQYLANMEVASSMSISILQSGKSGKSGKLWGLICCHDDKPKYVPYPIRVMVQLMGKIVALQLSVLHNAQKLKYKEQVQSKLSKVTSKLRNPLVQHTINELLGDMMELVNASGTMLKLGNRLYSCGNVPDHKCIQSILAWLEQKKELGIFCTNELSACLALDKVSVAIASGLMASCFGMNQNSCILFFRPELVQKLKWAGNPRLEEMGGGADQYANFAQVLTPRKSFMLWEETVRAKSQPWQAVEIEALQYLADAIYTYQMDKELKRSNEELEQFAYVASHDLQEPLRVVSGFIKLLKENYAHQLDEQAIKYIDYADSGACRMQKLVIELLEYASIHKGVVKYEYLDMTEMLELIKENLSDQIQGSNAQFTYNDLPIVYANRVLFLQLLQNLVSNALKYQSSGTQPCIQISVVEKECYLYVSIKDNGIGMREADLQKIFEPFKRLHGRSQYSGTGMGLAICRKIVEGFGGKLWVESELSIGSIFNFSLPILSQFSASTRSKKKTLACSVEEEPYLE